MNLEINNIQISAGRMILSQQVSNSNRKIRGEKNEKQEKKNPRNFVSHSSLVQRIYREMRTISRELHPKVQSIQKVTPSSQKSIPQLNLVELCETVNELKTQYKHI
eukprot:TRINITY_DN36170_c2_g1_i1.p1 TRINITY_DN36170_c2_g1~~TRINITY_DN36170_c2_g1_i1.p1  ORF type:complete len:106 (+),score=3.92 TRINITY_DN36170_c2_g1_i1:75-392(+)